MKISEDDYRSTYLDPKVLEPLGYPYRDISYVRRGSSAGYKTYNRSYYPDYLFLVERTPALVIEAKASERDFDYGFQEGLHHAKNYNPDRIIPFLLVAAGERVEMFEARVAGLAVKFTKLDEILGWDELCTHVRAIYSDKPPPEEAVNPAAAPVFTNIFEDIFEALKRSRRPKFGDEDAVVILNDLLLANVYGHKRRFAAVVRRRKIPRGVAEEVRAVLGRYDLAAIEGEAAAYAYRQFVTAYFRGLGSTKRGKEELVRTGRYLTPFEVIDFMVKLAAPRTDDRIVDPACGSGGFLGGLVSAIPVAGRDGFVKKNLVGCEIDPFCAAAARTFVELLLPGEHPALRIFHHNGLYSEKRLGFGDITAEVVPGSFDLVIGNPPANASYSGGRDADFVAGLFGLPLSFSDGEAFLARAMELCAPRGRIVLVVADGLLANMGPDQELRNSAQEVFQPILILSLPRVFPFVSSKMSVLYLSNVGERTKKKPVFMARVELGPDIETGEERILSRELDAVLDAFYQFAGR